MERIQEMSVKVCSDTFAEETVDTNVAMDCLTVPAINCNTRQQTRMSPRQNSPPARKKSTSSLRGSPRRSSKQGTVDS